MEDLVDMLLIQCSLKFIRTQKRFSVRDFYNYFIFYYLSHSLICREIMSLSDICPWTFNICSQKRTVFREGNCELRGFCVYYPSTNIFRNTRDLPKLGNITHIFPSFSWGISIHVTRLDQSRASENI